VHWQHLKPSGIGVGITLQEFDELHCLVWSINWEIKKLLRPKTVVSCILHSLETNIEGTLINQPQLTKLDTS
jgi:hypothetical protein